MCVRAWERQQKEEINISVRAAWERERAKRGEEYICACVRWRGREQNEEMNISVRACVRGREQDEDMNKSVRACLGE